MTGTSAHEGRGRYLSAGTGTLKAEGKWFSRGKQQLALQEAKVSFLLGPHVRQGVLVSWGFSQGGASVP